MKMNLNGGVLIVGSLFWQDDLKPEKEDGIRKQWRENRLVEKNSVDVMVPIRYGRLSGQKKNDNQVYTMVFDKSLHAKDFGIAKAIPFQNVITSWQELESEVVEMSKAEGTGNSFVKGMKAWCVCSIIFNPKVSLETQASTLKKWHENLKSNLEGYGHLSQARNRYCVGEEGELLISWPKYADDFDFLIATSTKAESDMSKITPEEIVKYIVNRDYFLLNRKARIQTFQDIDIEKLTGPNV